MSSRSRAAARAAKYAETFDGHELTRTPRAPWYADPWSECPACGHGPQWHNNADGCVRMNPDWCPCTRFYGAEAADADDWEETAP